MPRPSIAAASLLAAALVLPPPAPAAPATLSRERVAAQGRQSAILKTARFGRYSIQVTSPQGTGLQLTDRMAGPGPTAGEAGAEDGRLDVFLDEGEYLIGWAHACRIDLDPSSDAVVDVLNAVADAVDAALKASNARRQPSWPGRCSA